MSKRFIDTSKYRQAWRKLDPKFRAAYSWLVENADAAGFWFIDLDHFRFECGYALDLEKFLRDIAGAVIRHDAEKLSIVDFIQVNYGELKEGYNPHKPALRALAASKVSSSLGQASSKLEDEGEEEEEGKGLKKERATLTHFTGSPFTSPEAIAAWVGFVEMRKKKGKPMTDRARELIVKDLLKMGEADAITSLDQSTRAGWVDVYPPKRDHTAARGGAPPPPMDRNAPIETDMVTVRK